MPKEMNNQRHITAFSHLQSFRSLQIVQNTWFLPSPTANPEMMSSLPLWASQIRMINDMFLALKNILKNRPKIVPKLNVDGYSEFILNDKNIKSKVVLYIQNECRWAQMKYDKLHPDRPLPKITPHVYRHTFCTNMVLTTTNFNQKKYQLF